MAAKALSCHFPASGRQTSGPKRPLSVRVELQHLDLLHDLLRGEDGSRSLSAVVCAAWALSLRCYTGLSDTCFGFEEVGTSSRVEADPSDGACNNRVALFRIEESMLLEDILSQGQGDECIAVDSSGQLNFNTSVLVRCGTATNGSKQPSSGAAVMSEKVHTLYYSEVRT
jgi:hypothetical protein